MKILDDGFTCFCHQAKPMLGDTPTLVSFRELVSEKCAAAHMQMSVEALLTN